MEFATFGSNPFAYLNYEEGEFDASDSTYPCSAYKATPAVQELGVLKTEAVKTVSESVFAGYFLRSSVATTLI